MYFHEEEKSTLAVLDTYCCSHPESHLIFHFEEGDIYECVFLTDAEDDNDEDLDSPDYDEFWTAYFTVLKVIAPGPNYEPYENGSIGVCYRHFPRLVTTLDGEVVYKAEGDD